jgi:hypothetical protein
MLSAKTSVPPYVYFAMRDSAFSAAGLLTYQSGDAEGFFCMSDFLLGESAA